MRGQGREVAETKGYYAHPYKLLILLRYSG